ncbi:unnamed protein product [Amoebophrya sp. A25]|nr:unnamed protein product [Amoebophrya sp. A25]|eukprot:GSA25T00001979001.1
MWLSRARTAQAILGPEIEKRTRLLLCEEQKNETGTVLSSCTNFTSSPQDSEDQQRNSAAASQAISQAQAGAAFCSAFASGLSATQFDATSRGSGDAQNRQMKSASSSSSSFDLYKAKLLQTCEPSVALLIRTLRGRSC